MSNADGFKKIEMFVGCRSLGECGDKSLNTFAVIMRRDGDFADFEEHARSETVCNSSSPQFCTSFELEYEESNTAQCAVRIDLYDRKTNETERLKDHDYIGKVTVSIHDILIAAGNHLTLQLSHPSEEKKVGIIMLSAEEIDLDNPENESDVQLEVCAGILRKRDWNKTILSQRYELQRAHRNDDAEGHTVWLPIYKSDRISKQRDSNTKIEFSSASLKYRHLCNGDDERRIRISLYAVPQTGKRSVAEVVLGMADFTLRDICELDPTEEVLQLERPGSEDLEDIGNVSILKAEPTDFGSHFSLQVNYETTEKYTCASTDEKRATPKRKRLAMPRRLSMSNRERSVSSKKPSIVSSVDALFSNSFTSQEPS